MTTRDDWERLAAKVKQRRTARGWTQLDIAARGGPSIDRIQAIEGVRATSYSGRTLAALERGLDWATGTVQAILDDREPLTITEATPATENAAEEEPIDLMKRGRELIEEGNKLIEQAERMLGQRAAGTDETRRTAG